MRAFILGLDIPGRRENAVANRERLGAAGIECEIVPGVNAGEAGWEERLTVGLGKSVYRGGRPLNPGEVCCAEGHYRIWSMVDREPCLVMEDDIEITDLERLVDMVTNHLPTDPSQFDFAQLYHGSWNKPPHTIDWTGEKWHCVSAAHWGTIGYIITPRGARNMCRLQAPIVGPADWFFKYCGPQHNVPAIAKNLTAYTIIDPVLRVKEGIASAIQK